MKYLLLLPLGVPALAILVNEFYFHFARGLPRWERVGHPLDTLTLLAPVLWLIVSSPSERNIVIYIMAAVFSCFFVIKGELVHADLCAPAERVNHAVLLIAHPLALVSLALLWPLYHASAGPIAWFIQFHGREFALSAPAVVLVFPMIYQAVYWNLIWKAPPAQFEARQ